MEEIKSHLLQNNETQRWNLLLEKVLTFAYGYVTMVILRHIAPRFDPKWLAMV